MCRLTVCCRAPDSSRRRSTSPPTRSARRPRRWRTGGARTGRRPSPSSRGSGTSTCCTHSSRYNPTIFIKDVENSLKSKCLSRTYKINTYGLCIVLEFFSIEQIPTICNLSRFNISIHLSVYLSIYLSIYLFVYLSIYLSIYLLSIYLSI